MRTPGRSRPPAWRPWLFLAVLCGGLYLLAWPLVWRLVILPQARPDRPGFLVEEFASPRPGGQPGRVTRRPGPGLELLRPDSSLRAYAVWRVPAPGYYRLDLQCDDYGSLALDNRALISLEPATSANNQGQARLFLEAGSHLLALELNNGPGRGWLTLQAASGGQEPLPLPLEDLSSIDLGNLAAWLQALDLVQTVCLAGLLAALGGLTWRAVGRTMAPGPERAGPGGGCPSGWLLPPWVLAPALGLSALALAWPTGQDHWFNGLPWGNAPQAAAMAVAIPWLLLLERSFLRRPLALGLLLGLLLLKLGLGAAAPQGGWSLRAYEAPNRLAAGQWEPTFETRWQPGTSGVLRGPLWEGADLPLAWQARQRISESERVGQPMILEVEGHARLPRGAGLALAAGGASGGQLTLSDQQGRSWSLPLAANLAQARAQAPAPGPEGGVRVRGLIHYDGRPWQDWSLIPALVEPGGEVRLLEGQGALWRGPEGLALSPTWLGLLGLLGRLADGAALMFLAAWGAWAGREAGRRGLLDPALLAASLLGLVLPWLGRSLGLGVNAALIAGLGLPLGLLGWLAARHPRLATAWGGGLGRVVLLALGPGLLGHFLLTWWHQAGQATLLSYGHDFGVYQLYAHKMAVEGDWWLRYMQFLHFQPLYPYVVSLLHVFFGQSLLAQNLLDVWAALGAAALLPILTQRLGGTAARGLAASVVYLTVELGPGFAAHLGRGLQEHTAMLLLMLTALAATSARDRSWPWAAAAGLLAMLTYLLRQDYAGALAGLGLWMVALGRDQAGQGWRGLWAGALAGRSRLWAYYLVLALGPLLVLGRNKFIGGLAVLTNPGHIDHLLGATKGLRSLLTILCAAPAPGYHSQAAWVLVPGVLLGLAALVWRGWPLRNYPLALGITLVGLLAPYLVIAPYAYEPRQSIHLLPLAALSLALAVCRQGPR